MADNLFAKALLQMAGIPISSMPEGLFSDIEPLSEEERLQRECDLLNAQPGNLKGIHCPKCNDKGVVYTVKEGRCVGWQCDCLTQRENAARIERSGLSEAIKRYTFDSFKTGESWQKMIKDTAQKFIQQYGAWFYIGGQSGCGKTHICTAIANHYLQQNKSVKYMLWRDEAVRILANTTNDEQRQELISPLKNVDVLYIDDFFKHRNGERPTEAETNLAFEILNYRYINQMTTIISSELTVGDIINIDEALGGRIYDMAYPSYLLSVAKDVKKNYRLRSEK